MITWRDVEDDFRWDGALCDIYVHGTTLLDWKAFLTFVRTGSYKYRFEVAEKESAIPESPALLFTSDCTRLLSVFVGGIRVNCHFFTPDEIELDIDPREVTRGE